MANVVKIYYKLDFDWITFYVKISRGFLIFMDFFLIIVSMMMSYL